ncbi:MAG: DsbA family protein [Myxococcota bacterium]
MKKYIVTLSALLLAITACDSSKTLDKPEQAEEAAEAEEQAPVEEKADKEPEKDYDIPKDELSWIPEQPEDMEPLAVSYVPTEGQAARGADEDEALVTIVEIGDYGCPDTEARRELVREVLDDYGTKVRYVYRNVVWVPGDYGPFAANLASAAAQNDNYWKAYEIIWQRFRKLDEHDKQSYLEPLGLTLKDLQRAETLAKKRMDENQKLAKELNVQWVPTFFVNGVPLVKVGDEKFKKYVEVQIDKAQALQEEDPDLQGEKLYRTLVERNAADQELPEKESAEKDAKQEE